MTRAKGKFEPGVEEALSYELESNDHEWGGYSSYYTGFHLASPDGSVIFEGTANSGAGVFGANCTFLVEGMNAA